MGEKLSAASAILLFIFMTFFNWFGEKVADVPGFTGSIEGGGGNAWQTLDLISIFLMLTIVAAIGVAVICLTDADFEPPISPTTFVAALRGFALLLILHLNIHSAGQK